MVDKTNTRATPARPLPGDLVAELQRLRRYRWSVTDCADISIDGQPLFWLEAHDAHVFRASLAEFRAGSDEAREIADPRILAELVAWFLNGDDVVEGGE